jgi:8-oxo-dGTP diphosphatase
MTHLPPAEHYARLHKLPFAAGAVIRNTQEQILLVKPNYRDGWLLPGGSAEAGESPKEACHREVLEEVGLNLPIRRLLCLDYGDNNARERFVFIFDGGVLTQAQKAGIVLQNRELTDFQFVSQNAVTELLNPVAARWIVWALQALETGELYYLENQTPI